MDAQAPNRLAPQPGYGAGPAHQHRSPLTTTRTPRPGPDQLALDKTHSLMNADMCGSVEDRGNGVDDALPLGGVHGLVGLLSLLGGTLLLEALRRDLLRTPTTLVLPRHVCLQSGRQAAAARPVSHTAKQRSSEGRILPPVCGNRHGVTRLLAGCIGADMGGIGSHSGPI